MSKKYFDQEKIGDCVNDTQALQYTQNGETMSQKKHRVNVSFTDDEYEMLNFWSKKRGQSLASFVRYLARDCIDEYEEARLAKIIEERKKGPFISHEEFWKELTTE